MCTQLYKILTGWSAASGGTMALGRPRASPRTALCGSLVPWAALVRVVAGAQTGLPRGPDVTPYVTTRSLPISIYEYRQSSTLSSSDSAPNPGCGRPVEDLKSVQHSRLGQAWGRGPADRASQRRLAAWATSAIGRRGQFVVATIHTIQTDHWTGQPHSSITILAFVSVKINQYLV